MTLINKNGTVIYDNLEKDPSHFENHHNRQEIKEAITYGSGYSINRQSESLGGEFFYSAKYYPNLDYIIRSALPYNVSLMRHLKADSHYVWFTLIISLILIIIFYRFTHKLGMSITKLQQFAMKADRNEPIDTDMQDTFPKNELGEISQHIIQIYKRLHQAKEDLYIEREKLITHLQISHEGLGVFNHRKEEILVNNLFTQYANLISDKNTEFYGRNLLHPRIAAHHPFHYKNKERSIGKGEKRMSLNIDKNGRIFAVECIIFQDDSFEISINDITQEKEQALLEKTADTEHCPRIENPCKQHTGISGNHSKQPYPAP